ncbi:DUF1697 domain-containing protein [Actinoallomurus purpureus]|uniref:DUF1697 domain-containing protein n=1 Tax=Actinoallomurus purpureus TaxID=478114 RepID=UPI002092D584|nr:DUF1697 domain-containing protein [Actinoallomurus purpureus]MCO6004615.1 DUF1697 domain-containing protein [Actinoallomurus purpureus]
MARYVALLRGVNVGRDTKVAMADFKDVLAALGHTDVRTHLNSGNAVFTGPEAPTERIAAAIEGRLAAAVGRTVPVMVRTAAELRAIVEGNPLEVRDPARFAVAFLAEAPAPERLRALDPAEFAPEELRLGEKELYLYFPDGLGRAKLPAILDKRLGVPATLRNGNTVLKLLTLSED